MIRQNATQPGVGIFDRVDPSVVLQSRNRVRDSVLGGLHKLDAIGQSCFTARVVDSSAEIFGGLDCVDKFRYGFPQEKL